MISSVNHKYCTDQNPNWADTIYFGCWLQWLGWILHWWILKPCWIIYQYSTPYQHIAQQCVRSEVIHPVFGPHHLYGKDTEWTAWNDGLPSVQRREHYQPDCILQQRLIVLGPTQRPMTCSMPVLLLWNDPADDHNDEWKLDEWLGEVEGDTETHLLPCQLQSL